MYLLYKVKNTSGVWTVTPKVEENGMEKDPAILKKQQVINAHDAIATSLRKKRKVDQHDKSEDPEEFPMEEENEDATDSPGKSKKKIGKQVIIIIKLVRQTVHLWIFVNSVQRLL